MAKNALSPKQQKELLQTLQDRFQKHMHRHQGITWAAVQAKLQRNDAVLWSLYEMERTGGEPDVVLLSGKKNATAFADCAAESPKGRRSLCYDRTALNARKAHKPKDSVENVAKAMGIDLLTEEEYRALQELDEFDTKTSSWIQTPAHIRKLGGALFCDRRYHAVFTYHNGAESYYAARGFRGLVRILS